MACETIVSWQSSNLCPLHWKADSQPLGHQKSPRPLLKLDCLFLIGTKRPTHILQMIPLLHVLQTSLSDLTFQLLLVSFDGKFFMLRKFHLSLFFILCQCFVCLVKNLLPITRSWKYSPTYSSGSIIVLIIFNWI